MLYLEYKIKMEANQLGKILADKCQNAIKNEKVVSIYIFGIEHAAEIKKLGRSGIKDVIKQSGLHSTYNIELSKAIKLSKYVNLK